MEYDNMSRYFSFALLLLSFGRFVHTAENCRIETAEKIFYIKGDKTGNFIQQSSCSPSINRQFNLFIQSSSGSMRAQDVARVLEEKFQSHISIIPSRIEANPLSSLVRSSLSLSNDWTFKDMAFLRPTPFFVKEGTKITMSCSNCHYPGKKQIKVDIQDKGDSTVRWITLSLAIKVKALVARESLFPHRRPLSREDFSSEEIYVTNPESIFSEENHLHFYRASRKIPKGETLRQDHLSAINLVSPGGLIDVFYEYQNLSLKTKASPLRFGHYGDKIQLKRGKDRNIIIGRVVDHNKVVVER